MNNDLSVDKPLLPDADAPAELNANFSRDKIQEAWNRLEHRYFESDRYAARDSFEEGYKAGMQMGYEEGYESAKEDEENADCGCLRRKDDG